MQSSHICLAGLFVAAASLSAFSKLQAEERAPSLAVSPFDSKSAARHQQAWAKHLKVDVEIRNSIGMKLRLIPPGEFMMGSPELEKERSVNEHQHKVRISKAFYLGKHEVTQGEWKQVMGTEPWMAERAVMIGDDYPVVSVNWQDASEFCQKLSRKEGNEYRLPTEAEWEYACRAGATTRFHFGDSESELGEYAWSLKNTWDLGKKYAQRIGQKKCNPFGLHDMHGNVWEWCQDWYEEKQSGNSLATDPQGPTTGSDRVGRGGSWGSMPVYCRSAYRDGFSPSGRICLLGFRLARPCGQVVVRNSE